MAIARALKAGAGDFTESLELFSKHQRFGHLLMPSARDGPHRLFKTQQGMLHLPSPASFPYSLQATLSPKVTCNLQ